ncbi:DUF6470 family protein [Ureibacillus sp. MALMAid1270]|uniref:DUF6470 family protein n=1 Tax=Ureibacillus sp. MALMAid1270 TaxID=3411629 RepID=UPI003BA4F5EB
MNIPKLQIQTTDAKIGLNIRQPVQRIEQLKAELDLQQPNAKLSVETTKSKLSIDAFEARESMGYKNTRSRTAEIAQQSIQEGLEGIARRALEGNDLMRIENGGNPIVQHAKSRGRQLYSSLNIKFIPQAGSVEVNYEPSKVDINIEPQKVINNTKINKPIHQYTPGSVKVEMLQYPSIKIDWLI